MTINGIQIITRTITTRELRDLYNANLAASPPKPTYILVNPGATAYQTFPVVVRGITTVPNNLPRAYSTPGYVSTDYRANKDIPFLFRGPHPELFHVRVSHASYADLARADKRAPYDAQPSDSPGALDAYSTVFVFNADHNPWDEFGHGPGGENNYVTIVESISKEENK